MAVIELFIEGAKVDLSDDISADITYSLADIRTPDKRQVNYSKTLTLPGTQRNNFIFGNIYDLDVENPANNPSLLNIGVNYTPKKLAKTILINDGVQVFDGTLRLWKVVQKSGGFIYYETSLFGKLFDLFGVMADALLTDLDFSDLNHALTWANIKDTWTNDGAFKYPFIDYGAIDQNPSTQQPDKVRLGALVPSIHYSVFLDKIFSYNNANYILNFNDRTIFDKTLVTPSKGEITGLPNYLNSLQDTPAAWVEWKKEALLITLFDNTLTNTVFSAPSGSNKELIFKEDISTSFQIKLNFEFSSTRGVGSLKNTEFHVMYAPPDGGAGVIFFRDYLFLNGAVSASKSFTFEVPKTDFLKDGKFIIQYEMSNDTKGRVLGGSSIRAASPIDTFKYPLVTGDILNMNDFIPVEIKQIDFIKDFIKYYNIFVTQDPDNPATFIFTPQIDFYLSNPVNAVNWSKKIDRNADMEFTPISQLTAKEYLITWKADKDYWNTVYTDRNKEIYGQLTYLADTDVTGAKETVTMLFSPAVMQTYKGSQIVAPAIYKVDTDKNSNIQTKKVDKFNSRLLIWGGLLPAGHNISLLNPDETVEEVITSYPYAGHLDNPIEPTYDLNFGNTYTTLPISPETQFTKYWSEMLREANHKDGKLISCKMLLKSLDIQALDFAALYRVDNQYYRLNKIKGFNPFELGTSIVELIKVIGKYAEAILTGNFIIDDAGNELIDSAGDHILYHIEAYKRADFVKGMQVYDTLYVTGTVASGLLDVKFLVDGVEVHKMFNKKASFDPDMSFYISPVIVGTVVIYKGYTLA